MATKRARTLDDEQFQQLLEYIDQNSTLPERDRLIVMLSFKAGLRVAEIAKIDLSAMLDVTNNRIGKMVYVFSHVAKKKRQREVPINKDLRGAIEAFRKRFPAATFVAISSQPFRYLLTKGPNGKPKPLAVGPEVYKRMSVTALTNYYWRLLHDAGFENASSHSGRRTFGTKLARRANQHHSSLRDVQKLMGHARLDTTENYIEYSDDVIDLMESI